MDKGKKVAVAAALAIVLVFAIVGGFLILTSGSPGEDLSWVPVVTPYVDDRVDLLSYDEYLDLDYFCYEVELNNSCEIAVLIVNTTQPIGINDYAIKTFEKNGIGQQGKDNGVLFVFSLSEKAWRVVTGDGVSGILSGANLTKISQDVDFVAELEAGNYSTAVVDFVYAIGWALVDNYHSEGHQDDYPISWIPLKTWEWYAIIAVMVVLTIVTKGRILIWIPQIIFALLSGGRGGWGGGGTGGGGARGRF